MLNLKGFAEFVDAVGGVTVDVHERLPIGGNSDPKSSVYHKATGGWIEPGDNQHMDGYQALWFARSRWAYTDYDRMQRQRCVIGAVVGQVDPSKVAIGFPKIAKAAKNNIVTGIKLSDLQAWVELSQRIKGASVKSLPFTDTVINVVHPDFDKIRRLVARAIATSAKPKSTATPNPGASAAGTPVKKKPLSVNTAQDVKDVC
jgi:anionic cell wall polymer biosynthesis LytR-Cps2A-Psr (LCP) family protein